MIAEIFTNFANELKHKRIGIIRMEHRVQIAAAHFCLMLYVSDSRYLPGETTLQTEVLKRARKSNVEFCKVCLRHLLPIFVDLKFLSV